MNSPRAKKSLWKGCAACLTWWAAAALINHILTPEGIRAGYIGANASGTDSNSGAALAHAGGEFRVVAANVLWLTLLDHYHHQYLASGGDWSQDKDILPVVHVITTLDPHFIEAYGVGFMILAETHRVADGAAMLDQGIAANPTSWQIVYDRAMIEAWYRKNPKAALPYALTARRLATDPFDRHRMDLFCATLNSEIAPTNLK